MSKLIKLDEEHYGIILTKEEIEQLRSLLGVLHHEAPLEELWQETKEITPHNYSIAILDINQNPIENWTSIAITKVA